MKIKLFFMKTATPISIQKIFFILGFFSISFSYGQVKKVTPKTLFGKEVKGSSVHPHTGIVRCASVEYEEFLQEKNPNRMTSVQFENWLAPLIKQQKAMRTSSQSGGIITIPVVVHVIHSGQDYGVASNILDAQVQSQITVLNQDFRKITGTPGDNSNPVGADTQIQFALAQEDPNGNPTNGIDRVAFQQESWSGFSGEIDMIVKPATIWDPSKYLNMWTVSMNDDVLGYAQFPSGSGLDGLNSFGGPSNTDGVVAAYTTFGSKDYGTNFALNAPYDKGRTMTHEVGHFLGLRHIWGDVGSREDGKNCSGSDYCDDTPVAGWENYDCLATYDSCPIDSGNDMPENYMDYTNDACMNIFTQNQKDRIVTVMTNSPRRSSLKTSTKNFPIALFANDAEVKLETSLQRVSCAAEQAVTIYNRGTTNLTSAAISYNINGGGNSTYNWTGNLATNQFITFNVSVNSATNGTINATVVNANGVADQRASNNTDSGTYTTPSSPQNFEFTNYVFRLQRDLFGSETSWQLKNSAGTVLYSSVPYSNRPALPLPSLITQNWTLPNNQCYTFTINDSASDGICCGSSGDGYYDIKSSDGLTIIQSGSNFKMSEKKTFSNNGALATNAFETTNDIYLYPNPAKETLNIHIPAAFGLPDSLSLTNSLGQTLNQKEVSTTTDLTLNTSSLSNGVYFITVKKDNQTKTLQFIKE